jgi:hypothetical protein
MSWCHLKKKKKKKCSVSLEEEANYKEVDMTSSHHLPEGTEENHRNFSQYS